MDFKKNVFKLVLAGFLLLVFPYNVPADSVVSEYEVKAAFLYQFPKFVEWPGEASVSVPSFNVCILGNAPFRSAFYTIAGKTIKGRRVVVSYLNRIEDLKECHVLFIGASEKGRLPQILAAVASRPILTVSDIKHFCSNGGTIGFVTINEKIRFEVNPRSAHRSGLRISSQLLKLAASVYE